MWEIKPTPEFDEWWATLDERTKAAARAKLKLTGQFGPLLPRPYADTLHGSRYPNLKELRFEFRDHPYRIFYAFDPQRTAMLLIGGSKAGDNRSYERAVAKAEGIHDRHLSRTKNSGGAA